MLEFDFEMDTHALEEKLLRLANITPKEIKERVTEPAAEIIKDQINADLYAVAKTHSAGGLKENLIIVDKETSNGSTAVGYTKNG